MLALLPIGHHQIMLHPHWRVQLQLHYSAIRQTMILRLIGPLAPPFWPCIPLEPEMTLMRGPMVDHWLIECVCIHQSWLRMDTVLVCMKSLLPCSKGCVGPVQGHKWNVWSCDLEKVSGNIIHNEPMGSDLIGT